MKKNKVLIALFTILFLLGMIASLVFTVYTMWAGQEASMFASKKIGDRKLTSFRCPLFMSPRETTQVSAVVENPSVYDIQPQIAFRVAHQVVLYVLEFNQQPRIAAGEQYPVSLEISREDAIYNGSLVLVSIYVTASYPQPSLWNNCGVVVLDFLGLSGAQTTWILVASGVAFSLAGYFLLRNALFPFTKRTRDALNGMGMLTVVVLAGLLCGIFRLWLASIISLVVSALLLVIVSLRFFLSDQ